MLNLYTPAFLCKLCVSATCFVAPVLLEHLLRICTRVQLLFAVRYYPDHSMRSYHLETQRDPPMTRTSKIGQ